MKKAKNYVLKSSIFRSGTKQTESRVYEFHAYDDRHAIEIVESVGKSRLVHKYNLGRAILYNIENGFVVASW